MNKLIAIVNVKEVTIKGDKEMKKEFAVLVDHKAVYSNNEHYVPVMIEANDIVEAMTSAEKYMDETVYLIKILERKSGIEKAEGCKKIKFEEILVNRGHGWKKADAHHSESSSTWNHLVSTSKTFKWDAWEIESTKYC